MVILNQKEYNFKNEAHPEYNYLDIYPQVGILENEACLLSDLAEMFKGMAFYKSIGDIESNLFIKDNLKNFSSTLSDIIILRVDNSADIIDLTNVKIILGPNNLNFYQTKIKVFKTDKSLYIANDILVLFYQTFSDYIVDGCFNYSNLIMLCMIVKDAGPMFEQILTENLPHFDRYCILDTGSTDGTQDVIKQVLKNKKGYLYEEPFVNFKVSRNRCLDLAGTATKYLLMLDDTYTIRGDLRSFLEEISGDQYSDSFSLMIQSGDSEYYSNRIIKSNGFLRYIHTIHEVITDQNNINVTIPPNRAFIFDHRADYMEKRTNDRKQFDLELLFKELKEDPNDPRALYYIAQTYGCMENWSEQEKYFRLRINHPVQGYIQEKIDAYFELARLLNFKKKEILNFQEWDECEHFYLCSYNLDNSRPDSLYFIGIHYYFEKNWNLCYDYFKRAFSLGYPLSSQYSLKPTLSFHFLPKFLTEVCYYVKDYITGEKAAKLFLTSSKYNSPGCESWNLVNSWFDIHNSLNKMGKITKSTNHPRKIMVIVADGGWSNWSGKDILTSGVGGSETWVIEMARYIKKNSFMDVVVFCRTDKSEFFEDVGYNPIELFYSFVAEYQIEYIIISRYTKYIPVALQTCKNVGVIFHDILTPDTIIPKHEHLKWVWGLTDWHCNHIKTIFPQFEQITKTLNYGINDNFKINNEIKIKNSFIYSSFPNRGLVVLLKMWPRIKLCLPDATLNIYCDINGDWVNKVIPDEMAVIKQTINQPGIVYHSWVSKSELAEAWKTAEYWLYPCKFEETFCLTAMEAAISKTFVISNNLAALGETIGDRGLIVQGDAETEQWQNTVILQLFLINEKNSLKNEKISLNYNWAISKTWEKQAKLLLNDLNYTILYYAKIKRVNDYLIHLSKSLNFVVDIGCGKYHFEGSHATVDWSGADYNLDIERSPLPFDKVDFYYCRHVIEDLRVPELVLKEMARTSNYGYIETPSIIAECCKCIDINNYQGCGYAHHSSLLWTENNVLMILPKYAFLETLFTQKDNDYFKELLKIDINWNNYYLYTKEKPLKFKILRYQIDFNFLDNSYLKLIQTGILHTINSNYKFEELIGTLPFTK